MSKEKLTAQIQELQFEVPENATVTEMTDILIEGLSNVKALLEEKTTQCDALTENIAEANELILGLEADLKAEIQKNTKQVSIELCLYKSKKGIEYQLEVPSFRFQGEKHISKEVNTNIELMEALIKAKFIHLKQITDV
ncbi:MULTISPECIES: hypothetical protein [Tenacibaculum]|uniref:hypothetical protein n=1 Tax=Tenacibaculum TaxID=104267 RepID=UPI001F1B830B|nr:hypothetical protein [Tenacibaculum piscium]